ncbi:MAG: DUF4115 domain-containing protein [Thermaceae bacterium]|nr:DUF4115 domain-containing protein [Thermaceae bacterium]
MCELGQRLREAREAKGLEVAIVAEQLKVRRVILQALEECRFEELPEPALARGYLRRYAQVLGLDPAPLLMMYPAKVAGSPTIVGLPVSGPVPIPSANRSGLWWIILAVLLLGGLGWLGWRSRSPRPAPAAVQAVPPAPPAPKQVLLKIATQPGGARVYLDGFLLGQAPVEARVEAGDRTVRIEAQGYKTYQQVITLQQDRNLVFSLQRTLPPPTPGASTTPTNPAGTASSTPANPASPANPTPTTATPTPSTGLVLQFEGNSWIRVSTPSGTQLFEGQPAKGTQLSYPLPVVVRVGNALAVRAIVNGQDRGLMGSEGQVVTQRFGQ